MNFKGLIAVAVVASLPMSAHALTITDGTANTGSLQITDQDGAVISGAATAAETNIELTSEFSSYTIQSTFLGQTNNGSVTVNDIGDTLGHEQIFTNNSGRNLVLAAVQDLEENEIINDYFTATVSNPASGPTDLTTDGIFNSILVAQGATVTFRWGGDMNSTNSVQFQFDIEVSEVPVPAGILLMGTALAGFGVMRRRKKRA